MRWLILFIAIVALVLFTTAQVTDTGTVSDLEEYAATVASLQQQIQDFHTRNHELEQHITAQQQQNQQREQHLQQREMQLQQAIQQLTDEKISLESYAQQLQLQVNEALGARTALEERVVQLEGYAGATNGRLAEVMQQLRDLQQNFDDIRLQEQTAAARVDVLEAEKQQLLLQLDETQNLASTHEADATAAKENMARLSAELVQSRKKEQEASGRMEEHAEAAARAVHQYGTCESLLQQKQQELVDFLRKSPDRHLGRALLSVVKSLRYIFLRILGIKPK